MMFPVMLAPTSMLPDVLIAQNSKIFLIWQTMRSIHRDISDFILRIFVHTCSISLREIVKTQKLKTELVLDHHESRRFSTQIHIDK